MKTKEELFAQLAELCVRYNAPDFHVFLDLSGHIDKADLHVYVGGWGREKKPDLHLYMYVSGIDDSGCEADIRQAIVELVRLHRLYRKQKRKKQHTEREGVHNA